MSGLDDAVEVLARRLSAEHRTWDWGEAGHEKDHRFWRMQASAALGEVLPVVLTRRFAAELLDRMEMHVETVERRAGGTDTQGRRIIAELGELLEAPDAAIPVQDQTLERLCVALGEPFETSAGPLEPPYRMTWDRALDLVRGKVRVWGDLLRRAQFADSEWLDTYRRSAGSAATGPRRAAALREALDDLWDCIDTPEIALLQESTRRIAQQNHLELHHGDD